VLDIMRSEVPHALCPWAYGGLIEWLGLPAGERDSPVEHGLETAG
jgi:hypothetical protein